jgi:hypothetical protein
MVLTKKYILKEMIKIKKVIYERISVNQLSEYFLWIQLDKIKNKGMLKNLQKFNSIY